MKINTSTRWAIGATIAMLVIVAAVVAIIVVQRPAPSDSARAASAIRQDTHILTDAGPGAVTVVEFLDFECEACRAAYPFVEDLQAEFGDRVTFAMRYFPLPGHFNSKNAAVAAEAAARQGQLESMYQRLFETQTQWGEQQTSQAAVFREFAAELGLDLEQFDVDIADPTTQARVESDFTDGRALGVDGTPTFFVNDQRIEVATIDDLRAAIEMALDR